MRMLMAAATAAAISMGGGASALTFGSIPAVGETNDVLENAAEFGGATTRSGWYGATLFLNAFGPLSITAEVLGWEAGFDNRFNFGGETFEKSGSADYASPFSSGAATTAGATGGSWTVPGVVPGVLSFSFCTDGGTGVAAGCVNNGSNPDDAAGDPGLNFFVSFENENASGGQIAYLFFDDTGAGDDDNHDDLVMKLSIDGGSFSVVPLPAAGFLLLGGLGGLAALGRRKSKAKKA